MGHWHTIIQSKSERLPSHTVATASVSGSATATGWCAEESVKRCEAKAAVGFAGRRGHIYKLERKANRVLEVWLSAE